MTPRHRLGIALTLAALGCSRRPPEGDEIVPIDRVPPAVMDAARKELPGVQLDTAFKMKIDGRDAYEVRGRDRRGKVREVEVSATGQVLAVE